MREKLARARARSDFETCASAAFGDELGNLLLRGLDNSDGDCLRRAKWLLAHQLTKRYDTNIVLANRTVHYVLRFLRDQRCPACKGRKQKSNELGVYRACLNCNATGLVGGSPAHWGENHQIVLRSALSCIGRALSQARAAAEPG